jgi:hypothetical protein
MKHLKRFSLLENTNEYDKDNIEDQLRQNFESTEDFDNWCMDVDDVDDIDDIQYDNIIGYDIPVLLDLPQYNSKLTEIINDILTEIDFDEYYEPRDGDIESWNAKNAAKKYNL